MPHKIPIGAAVYYEGGRRGAACSRSDLQLHSPFWPKAGLKQSGLAPALFGITQ